MRLELVSILHVDDNEDDHFFVTKAFRRAGVDCVIHRAEDGAQALAFMREKVAKERSLHPRLVLLDINMPVLNGYQVLEEMKKDPALASIPVIMLTTSSNDADLVKSYSLGACSYVTKPVGIAEWVELAKGIATYWTKVSTIPGGR